MWKLVLPDEASPDVLYRKMERSGVQRITINHVLTLSSIGELAVKGPDLLRAIFSFLGNASNGISFSSSAVRCTLKLSIYQETVAELLLLLLYPMAIFLCMYFLSLRFKNARRVISKEFLVGVAVLVCYLKYTSALQSMLSLFGCVKIANGESYLIEDMRVQCGGSTYNSYTTVAGFFTFVFAFGV